MCLDEVYLIRGNEMFVFNRREIRLFQLVQGERNEVTDRRAIAAIVTSPATVLPVCRNSDSVTMSAG